MIYSVRKWFYNTKDSVFNLIFHGLNFVCVAGSFACAFKGFGLPDWSIFAIIGFQVVSCYLLLKFRYTCYECGKKYCLDHDINHQAEMKVLEEKYNNIIAKIKSL